MPKTTDTSPRSEAKAKCFISRTEESSMARGNTSKIKLDWERLLEAFSSSVVAVVVVVVDENRDCRLAAIKTK
jgi:hypothetical protein